jgi:uncharacterized SAM-binding protein YcdF (DUF218 family)
MWWRKLRLVRRCTIWWPTWFGACSIAVLLLAPVAWWINCGESYLCLTDRLQPEILVVEGWIGLDGVRAAEAEFEHHGYHYIVATGDLHTDSWEESHSSLADLTARELIRLGVSQDRIIVAPAKETERHRTYESSIAVRQALLKRRIHPKTLNVFTLGPHARRSHLIFAKIEGPVTRVGVISWIPADYEGVPWWSSSWRAKVLLTESIGYLYEALFDSGRSLNSPISANTTKPLVETGTSD